MIDPLRSFWSCPRCGASVKQIDRHRDGSGHLSRHCGCGVKVTLAMTPDELRLHKRQVKIELKRKYRRQAGARLRADIAAETQAKREAAAIKGAIRLQIVSLHDAHVKRYVDVLRHRAYASKRYRANPQAERERASIRKQKLLDSYLIGQLRAMGIPKDTITPDLIALKREAMQYGRLARHIKSTVKNHWKEQNETITKHP